MSLKSLTLPDNATLPNTVAALSLLAATSGLFSVADPLEAIPQIGLSFPVRNDKKSMDLSFALARVYGIRNVSTGLVNLALWWSYRHATGPAKLAWRHALGLALIFSLATPVVDGVMCEVQGRTTGWKHWAFAPVTAILGAGLLLQA